ncbi:hypothetical protein PFBG_04682 [Plasmodium falciparum 7G8]|uniref:LMBR1 domain-containing protein n=1 Tax=Plasmodium falciparum (isolate 7G8) TaxID=57266 RepID=W7F6W4_PLAF8|nr:hypothetical protein PFBG_04682 [Plasmodium falciparum 7G8]
MFWVLIFEAYVLVPFSYFYLKNKKSYKNEFDDNVVPFENTIESLKKTIYFILLLIVLSIIGLIYRPGHKLAMEKGKELEYISDLFDVKHTGESAIIFLMGCVVLMGVSFWATYTSYGIACLPLSLLQQRNIDHDKKEIENRFMSLKEKEIMIKYFNSICAYKCGFVLEQINTIFNLLDTLLIFFSKFFPLDILIIASLAIYIFCCSLYGIVNVGIRICFIPLYKLKPKKSSPETLLVLCFLIIHIILVLIMTLLTIAPNYITYGIQKIKLNDNLGYIKCSLKTDKHICKMSVLSVFFNKIFFGIPYFANSYFFSNWLFIIMFTLSFFYRLFFNKISYLDNIDESELNKESFDENMKLLPLEKLT